jgi:hypothetical protein
VPKAKKTLYSSFYFINSSAVIPSCYWSRYPIIWQNVQGKITYYSQQNSGLLKFVIDKNNVLNEDKDFYYDDVNLNDKRNRDWLYKKSC